MSALVFEMKDMPDQRLDLSPLVPERLNGLSRKDIQAIEIGTTRETLAHTLADFRARGLLDTEKHQVLIRDAEQLMDIAEGLEDLDG